jgi:hypothetical protein
MVASRPWQFEENNEVFAEAISANDDTIWKPFHISPLVP